MSSEPYVPSVEEMREYVVTGGEYRPWAPPGDGAETARGEAFDRFVARVRADALRGAARFFAGGLHCADMRTTSEETVKDLRRMADRAEQEARGGQ